jgi:N-glycosylase/DNA lyase
VKLRKDGEYLFIESDNDYHLHEVIRDYFDFYTDYQNIEAEISKIDDNIQKAVNNTSGLRILNQNFFEIVISYIISANNNIPRISKSIEKISQRFGQKIIFEDQEYYLFPRPALLQKASMSDLQDCGV